MKQHKKIKKVIIQHKPVFDKSDALALANSLKKGWVSEGPQTKDFQENFRTFVGAKYAVATTSGTTAIFLALISSGIKANDEVIIPNLTFVATATAVKLLGAKPILAEINEDNFALSIESVKKKITKKTTAVIPVHLNGRCTNMDELKEVCRSFDLRLIEDASQALGSKYKKKYLGSIGDAAAFSLSPPKIITTGQGGIVTTNSFEIFDNLRKIKDQGRYDKTDHHPIIGYNFKFTDIQAALGNSQFSKLRHRLSLMRKIHDLYAELLEKNKSLIIPPKRKETQLWYFDILTKRRKKLVKYLLNNGIMSRLFYKPLSVHKPYHTKEKFPVTDKISSTGLYLPSSVDLKFSNVEYICNEINSFH